MKMSSGLMFSSPMARITSGTVSWGEADEGREVELPLRDQLAVAVVDHAGEVSPLVDGGGVGGLGHHQSHLIADRREGVAQHFVRNRVDLQRGTDSLCHVSPFCALSPGERDLSPQVSRSIG